MSEVTFTDENFDSEISSGVALVDFWAPWCGPCRMQGPIVEKVADALGDKAKVGKCNIDESAQIASKFGINSIPTLIVFKDGNEVKRFRGVQQESTLVSAIEENL